MSSVQRIPFYARSLVQKGELKASDFVGAEPFLFDAVAEWVNGKEARLEADFADESGLPILDRPPVRAPFAKVWAEWMNGGTQCGALVVSDEDRLKVRLFMTNNVGPHEFVEANVSLLQTGQLAASFMSHEPWLRGWKKLHATATEERVNDIDRALALFYECEGGKQEESARQLLIKTVNVADAQRQMYTSPDDVLRDHTMDGLLAVVLWGFALCHAKNITAPLTDMPRAARRSADKEGIPDEVPARRFRVLQISGLSGARSSLDQLGRDTVSALHLVRGHFVRYTEAAPLFGRYTGTFWRSPHLRGDAERGSIAKIYEPTVELEPELCNG